MKFLVSESGRAPPSGRAQEILERLASTTDAFRRQTSVHKADRFGWLCRLLVRLRLDLSLGGCIHILKIWPSMATASHGVACQKSIYYPNQPLHERPT